MIVVVFGPGGAGKGTLVERLLERDPRLWLSRSWTTRPPRPHETDEYVFVTRERFEERVAAGGFLEWAEFLGNLYGTPVPEVPEGRDVLLEIDAQGARQVAQLHPRALLVWVDVPSPEVQAGRLRGRGDPEEEVRRRVAVAGEERAVARELGATTVVNDELERATDEVLELLRRRRAAG